MLTVLCGEIVPYTENKYKIIGILFKDHIHLNPGKKYVYLDAELGLKIRNMIATGIDVIITEDTLDSRQITMDDLEIIEYNNIDLEKNKLNKQIQSMITYYTATISALDFYTFFTTNAYLSSKGYNIIDENREEIYLQIIESDNQELLSMLEEYIEAKENIDSVAVIYKKLKKHLRNLNSIQTKEELESFKNDLNSI